MLPVASTGHNDGGESLQHAVTVGVECVKTHNRRQMERQFLFYFCEEEMVHMDDDNRVSTLNYVLVNIYM